MNKQPKPISAGKLIAKFIEAGIIIGLLAYVISLTSCTYTQELARNCNLEATTVNDTTRACVVCKGLRQTTINAINELGKSAINANRNK